MFPHFVSSVLLHGVTEADQTSSARWACQQGQEVNRAGHSASSPLPLTDCCTWVTSWVSGPNSCEWPETGSAACLVLLNIAVLPTCTQQFLPTHPPFSPFRLLQPSSIFWFIQINRLAKSTNVTSCGLMVAFNQCLNSCFFMQSYRNFHSYSRFNCWQHWQI